MLKVKRYHGNCLLLIRLMQQPTEENKKCVCQLHYYVTLFAIKLFLCFD
jgi:hypothetical protein